MSIKPQSLAPNKVIKFLLYISLFTMVSSGAAWFILDNFFQQKSLVGLQKHPWQGVLMSIHGFCSYLFAVIFGSIIFQHVIPTWQSDNDRRSGLILIISISFLIISGASFLFLPIDPIHGVLTWAHLGVGVVLLLSLAVHVFLARRLNSRL